MPSGVTPGAGMGLGSVGRKGDVLTVRGVAAVVRVVIAGGLPAMEVAGIMVFPSRICQVNQVPPKLTNSKSPMPSLHQGRMNKG